MSTIRFGTDGWRAKIAEDFTFSNVEIVAQATADYVKTVSRQPKMVVGYDTRFLSDAFALRVAQVLQGNDIEVVLPPHPTPVPIISYTIKAKGLSGGIMITASHNPPIYNGFKFKTHLGGPADVEVTKKIESLLGKSEIKKVHESEIVTEDLFLSYFEHIKSFINFYLIKEANLSVIVDSMYGAGDEYLAKLLADTTCRVQTIHKEDNPRFGGIPPEPIEKNLTELIELVRSRGPAIGLATDGDADRIGAVTEEGEFLNPHMILSLLFQYLVESRGWSGDVAKTISTTSLLDRLAKDCHREVYETPVGFKYLADLMVEKDILIAGEESGGIGYKNHIPERDGLLSGLLILEMVAAKGKRLAEIFKDLQKEYGHFYYERLDIHYPEEAKLDKEKIVSALTARAPESIAGLSVKEIKTFDGIKFILEDNSWLLIRPSGTEPLVRIYAESTQPEKLQRIIKEGRELRI